MGMGTMAHPHPCCCHTDTPIACLPFKNAYFTYRRQLQLFPCALPPLLNLSRPLEDLYKLAATHVIKI